MDTSLLVNQIVDAQIAAKAAEAAQKRAAGVTGVPMVNQKALKAYKELYPQLPLDDPQKLMAMIDARQRVSWDRRDGGDPGATQVPQSALSEIYGINAYKPKGSVDTNVPKD